MAVNQQRKTSIKRLKADLEELSRSPVAGISAAPLEDDMFEWHCNILLSDVPQHLILFIPEEYPYKAPSAELTGEFMYDRGSSMPGLKGTKICMPLFSDYEDWHTEWKSEKALGWSPGYTVQTCLLNTLSFLADTQQSQHINTKSAEGYCCPDCGHSFKTPYPPIHTNDSVKTQPSTTHHASNTTHLLQTRDTSPNTPLRENINELIQDRSKPKLSRSTSEEPYVAPRRRLRRSRSDIFPRDTSRVTIAKDTNDLVGKLKDLAERFQIIDYMSKDTFEPQVTPTSNNDIYGYGLEIKINHSQKCLATPYEILTAGSFLSMKESNGYVQSIMKWELSHFLPLYLCSSHASGIKDIFEQTVKEICTSVFPYESPDITITEQILNMIPMLLWDGRSLKGDSRILGYFAIHRLLLWAIDTYTDLQEMVDARLQAFIDNPECRSKKACLDLGALPIFLAVSAKYRWLDIADSYMSEFWRRQTTDYVRKDANLGMVTQTNHKWERCFKLMRTRHFTYECRKQLAFQVRLINIAMPRGMSRDDVIARYDENLGFPTDFMIAEMKNTIQKIDNCAWRYADWFKLLKLTAPSNRDLFQTLNDALHFCLDNDDYNLSSPDVPSNGWHKATKLYKAALESGKMSRWGTKLPKQRNSHSNPVGSNRAISHRGKRK